MEDPRNPSGRRRRARGRVCFDSFVTRLRDARRWPETRRNFDRRKDPRLPVLAADEGANLVGLELLDFEPGDPFVVESTTHLGCPLEPPRDGVPGNPLDPCDRRNADTLDSEGDDRVESSSSMLETLVGRASRLRERLSALDAPVSATFPGPRSVESVAGDVSGPDFPMERTCGIETSAILHSAWPLSTKDLTTLEIGLNSSTQRGYTLAANT